MMNLKVLVLEARTCSCTVEAAWSRNGSEQTLHEALHGDLQREACSRSGWFQMGPGRVLGGSVLEASYQEGAVLARRLILLQTTRADHFLDLFHKNSRQ